MVGTRLVLRICTQKHTITSRIDCRDPWSWARPRNKYVEGICIHTWQQRVVNKYLVTTVMFVPLNIDLMTIWQLRPVFHVANTLGYAFLRKKIIGADVDGTELMLILCFEHVQSCEYAPETYNPQSYWLSGRPIIEQRPRNKYMEVSYIYRNVNSVVKNFIGHATTFSTRDYIKSYIIMYTGELTYCWIFSFLPNRTHQLLGPWL